MRGVRLGMGCLQIICFPSDLPSNRCQDLPMDLEPKSDSLAPIVAKRCRKRKRKCSKKNRSEDKDGEIQAILKNWQSPVVQL